MLCVLPAVGCATSGSGATAASPDMVGGAAIRATRYANLYEALRAIRPSWLRGRGPASMVSPRAPQPVVYVAGIRHGAVDTLRTMNVDQVRQVIYIAPVEAMTRYGMGHDGGVILVDLDRNR